MASVLELSTDEICEAAWKALAANPNLSNGFPRGFWPDLARVAVEMARQGTLDPELDFRPTRSGDISISMRRGKKQRLPPTLEAAIEETKADNPFMF